MQPYDHLIDKNLNLYRIIAYFISLLSIVSITLILLTIDNTEFKVGSFVGYLAIAVTIGYFIYSRLTVKLQKRKRIINTLFPGDWRKILLNKVNFYKNLTDTEKDLFEKEVQIFLATTRITGIQTEIDDTDRILIAASAVIPIFGFQGWEYDTLDEVLLYPKSFNENYETAGEGDSISGMVGSGGEMEGKMILSKPSLHNGFAIDSDKKNVGIHEFVHLIDKADGIIDGVPELLLENQYAIPWLDLIHKKMEQIFGGKSDINPYGAVSKVEFFAVASEYFFERPKLLKQKHPELYKSLKKVFRKDMISILKHQFTKTNTGRNDLCPCGSGTKFKHCCGKTN